jgi:hypothetical protein
MSRTRLENFGKVGTSQVLGRVRGGESFLDGLVLQNLPRFYRKCAPTELELP